MPSPVPPESVVPGAHVAAALKVVGMSRSELARRMGVTVVSVNRWVRGRSTLNLSRWYHILAVLGLPSTWTP